MSKPCIESVIGTWFIDGMPFGEEGILVITPECRVIQFPTSVTMPRMNQTMRLWGSNDVDDHILLRPSPAAEGWLRRVAIADSGWIMIATLDGATDRFSCRDAADVFLPPWFAEQLNRNLLKMAEIEANTTVAWKAVGIRKPNPTK